MAVILSRVARNFAVSGGAARSSLSSASSSPSPLRRFSSPSLRPAVAVAVARSDVAADVDEEGHGSLDHAAASVVKAADPTVLQPRVVVYDGVCHLCHRGVKWVIKADKHRKIKFCCLQSKAAEPYMRLCGLEQEDVLRRFLFIEGLGECHTASTAALKVISYLPLPYSTLSALLIVPTPLRDAVYDYVAKRRYYWFGKEEDCLVLREQDMLERFIDRDEMLDRSRSVL